MKKKKKWKINIDHGVQYLNFQNKKKNGVKLRGVKLCYMQINDVVLNRNLAILNQND